VVGVPRRALVGVLLGLALFLLFRRGALLTLLISLLSGVTRLPNSPVLRSATLVCCRVCQAVGSHRCDADLGAAATGGVAVSWQTGIDMPCLGKQGLTCPLQRHTTCWDRRHTDSLHGSGFRVRGSALGDLRGLLSSLPLDPCTSLNDVISSDTQDKISGRGGGGGGRWWWWGGGLEWHVHFGYSTINAHLGKEGKSLRTRFRLAGVSIVVVHASFRVPNLKTRLASAREDFRAVW